MLFFQIIFDIVNTDLEKPLKRIDLEIKDVVSFNIEVTNSLRATAQILAELEKKDLKDKLVLLRVRGILESGKHSDIKFAQIEALVAKKGAYFLLRNTNNLKIKEVGIEENIQETENIEDESLKKYAEINPSTFNNLIPQLMGVWSTEKQEGETTETFTSRLLEETKKVIVAW